MDHVRLSSDKLDVSEIYNSATSDDCGAVSLFVGTTRDNFNGKKVQRLEYALPKMPVLFGFMNYHIFSFRLEYECYESMALKEMRKLCTNLRTRWPDIRKISIEHRLG